jgi:hypothetical protein
LEFVNAFQIPNSKFLPAGFWTLWIQPIAFSKRGFLAGVAQIQFRMTPMRLDHVRTLAELRGSPRYLD